MSPRRRRRVSPFLLIAFTLILIWFGYLGHQLVGLTGLDIVYKVIGYLVLALPFLAVFWLPFFHWRDEDPTPAFLQPLLARTAFMSMGYLSLLLFAVVLRDGAWVVTRDARLYGAEASALTLAFAAVLLAVGHLFAQLTPREKKVRVAIKGLPPAFEGYRIVQLSDMHIGATMPCALVERVVERVNGLEPDLVVFTGDIFEGDVAELRELVAPLTKLKARDGKLFVTGNHEYYWGADQWLRELPALGLRDLGNANLTLARGADRIVIAGINDAWTAGVVGTPATALEGAPADATVRILLSHQPKVAADAAAAGYTLQLSGHTHGGQFLPWIFFAPLVHGRLFAGLAKVQDMWVYVSRGTGSWGPLVRLGAPTEISVITLTRAQN